MRSRARVMARAGRARVRAPGLGVGLVSRVAVYVRDSGTLKKKNAKNIHRDDHHGDASPSSTDHRDASLPHLSLRNNREQAPHEGQEGVQEEAVSAPTVAGGGTRKKYTQKVAGGENS